jgi:hypothetical protein
MVYVPNTPEIRQAIKDWNKSRPNKDLKLKPRGRGPDSCRQFTQWGRSNDATLSKARILAVYWMKRQRVTWAGETWSIWNATMAPSSIPKFLADVALKTKPILA